MDDITPNYTYSPLKSMLSTGNTFDTPLIKIDTSKVKDPYNKQQLNLMQNNQALTAQKNKVDAYYSGLNVALTKDYQDQLNYYKHYNNMLAGIGTLNNLGTGLMQMWQTQQANSNAFNLQKQNTLVQLAEQNTRWHAVATQANSKFSALLGARAGSGRNANINAKAIEAYNAGKVDTTTINTTISHATDAVNNITAGHTALDHTMKGLGILGATLTSIGAAGDLYLGGKSVFGSTPTFNNHVNNFLKNPLSFGIGFEDSDTNNSNTSNNNKNKNKK